VQALAVSLAGGVLASACEAVGQHMYIGRSGAVPPAGPRCMSAHRPHPCLPARVAALPAAAGGPFTATPKTILDQMSSSCAAGLSLTNVKSQLRKYRLRARNMAQAAAAAAAAAAAISQPAVAAFGGATPRRLEKAALKRRKLSACPAAWCPWLHRSAAGGSTAAGRFASVLWVGQAGCGAGQQSRQRSKGRYRVAAMGGPPSRAGACWTQTLACTLPSTAGGPAWAQPQPLPQPLPPHPSQRGGPAGPSIPEVAAEDTSQPAAAFAAATATAHAQKQQLAVAFADPVVSAQADRWQRRQQQVASAALQRQQAAGGLLPAPQEQQQLVQLHQEHLCCSQALRSLHLQQMQQHLAAAVLLQGNPPEWSPSSFPN
jgi:hypothetical protein